MHHNYYFLRQLCQELKAQLSGFKLIDAYSQNKDEAIFEFEKGQKYFYLIAHLTGQFTCLAFPEGHKKARKNTATIFPELSGASVLGVEVYSNERAFFIEFENKFKLIFKLFGRQANLILSSSDGVINIFRKGFSSDIDLIEAQIDKPIDQSSSAIINSLPEYRKIFPTLNKGMINLIDAKIQNQTKEEAAIIISEIIEQYKKPVGYLLENTASSIKFEFALDHSNSKLISSPIEAITEFFYNSIAKRNFTKLQTTLLSGIVRNISKTEVYLSKTKRKLKTIEVETNYKEIADIIMANLHVIEANTAKVELDDFYNNCKIEINLKPLLNAQQNAARYYRKAKNLKIEIDNLKDSIKSKTKYLNSLNEHKLAIEKAISSGELRQFIKKDKVNSKSKSVPFKEFIIGGYTIYVGNNAKQNDLLTLKYAKKNDLFFHAKDVSGSHVILKQKSGTNVPEYVLEATASLAAYYSKRKTDTLCPVGYTEKKYVRKPKGSPPGLVLVEREKVLLVPPKLP